MGTRTVVVCSACGRELGLLPAFRGEEHRRWLGNACTSCGRAYCSDCVTLDGPTACPECGRPTREATVGVLRAAGVLP